VAKVDDLHFDAVLHDAAEDDHIHLKPLPFPVPVHGLAIEPEAPRRRAAHVGDPGQAGGRGPVPQGGAPGATNETVVYGLGELHLRVLLERLRDVTSSRSDTRPPRIAYRETITQNAEGTTATRSSRAAPASSARCTCASSRCRAARASSSSIRSRAAPSPAVHPGG
jgi:elongation factor G